MIRIQEGGSVLANLSAPIHQEEDECLNMEVVSDEKFNAILEDSTHQNNLEPYQRQICEDTNEYVFIPTLIDYLTIILHSDDSTDFIVNNAQSNHSRTNSSTQTEVDSTYYRSDSSSSGSRKLKRSEFESDSYSEQVCLNHETVTEYLNEVEQIQWKLDYDSSLTSAQQDIMVSPIICHLVCFNKLYAEKKNGPFTNCYY